MSDVGRNFPKCHLMSETFPLSIDSAERDETAGDQAPRKRGNNPFETACKCGKMNWTQSTRLWPKSSRTEKYRREKDTHETKLKLLG